MENVHDIVEKLVFPMELDDEYDRGKINEFKSQVNLFQGALSNMNNFIYDQNKSVRPSLIVPKMLMQEVKLF